jgi:hypothetical protein
MYFLALFPLSLLSNELSSALGVDAAGNDARALRDGILLVLPARMCYLPTGPMPDRPGIFVAVVRRNW